MSQRANAGPPLALPSAAEPAVRAADQWAATCRRRPMWPRRQLDAEQLDQPLTPQAGAVLAGSGRGEAPPYRSAPDFPPAAPPPPPFAFLPVSAPDVPLPPKKSICFPAGSGL